MVERVLEGESLMAMMDSRRLCWSTGYNWRSRIQGRGCGKRVLIGREGTGRPGKLAEPQKRQVFRWINDMNSKHCGFDFS